MFFACLGGLSRRSSAGAETEASERSETRRRTALAAAGRLAVVVALLRNGGVWGIRSPRPCVSQRTVPCTALVGL